MAESTMRARRASTRMVPPRFLEAAADQLDRLRCLPTLDRQEERRIARARYSDYVRERSQRAALGPMTIRTVRRRMDP